MTYSRFGLYVLGADWYNFVADPDIVYGDLEGLIGMAMHLGCQMSTRRRFSTFSTPCSPLEPSWTMHKCLHSGITRPL